MVDKIEMSLDEIIKSNRGNKKASGSVRRGGGVAARKAGRRSGAIRGSPRKQNAVGAVFGSSSVLKGRNRGVGIQKAKFARGDVNSAWKHDMYDGPKRGGILKAIGGDVAKLLVSNLDYGVSDSDIQELFTEFGSLKKAAVHYDRSGRSLGTADVVFDRKADALKAIKQYHGVPLDGRPMNIQLATSDVAVLARNIRSAGISAGSAVGKRRPASRRGAPAQRGQRAAGGRNAAAAGGVRRVGKKTAPTAEELDAELDAYVNDMKI